MVPKYSIAVSVIAMALMGCEPEGTDETSQLPTTSEMAAAGERQIEESGAVIDDSTVTAKVKAALVVEPDLKGFAIDVDTSANVVTLSGTVASDDVRERAERVTRSVEGVKDVTNNLTVNPAS